LLIKIWP